MIFISSYEATFAICKGLCRFEGPAGFPAAVIDCTGKNILTIRAKNRFYTGATTAWLVMALTTISPGRLPAADDTQSDPHWNKSTCETCHLNAIPAPGKIELRAHRAEQLCESCHGRRGNARSCRHSSDVPVGDRPLPESYRDPVQYGQLVCTTCHDLTVQCRLPYKQYRSLNTGFVRDRSSPDTSEHCYGCHDEAEYE